ncbi:MAG: hypothetical protein J5524_10360 [Bacteroidaceae bacterium]|nr:hypothetical protein [Bacteroidaceae bacterium]
MKRFTLKRVTLALATCLMLLSSQSVMAQYFKLTALSGQNAYNGDSEHFDKLVDTKTSTKWGTWFDHNGNDEWPDEAIAYIIVKADEAVVPDFYFLVTGNDTGSNPGRNWKSWKIYGGNFESDDQAVRDVENYTGWTLIDDRQNEPLPGQNFGVVNLEFNETDGKTAYKYFWIEIEESVKGSETYLQMSEWGLGTYAGLEKYLEDLANEQTGTDQRIKYNIISGDRIDGSGESLEKLFDGDINTKWGNGLTAKKFGETTNGAHFIVKTSRAIAPTYYKLVTGTDNASWHHRNWKNWQIYGIAEADVVDGKPTRDSDKWVLLDKKTDVSEEVLPDKNCYAVYFTLSEENTTAYKYFKVEIDETMAGSGYMQMSEFELGDEYIFAIEKNEVISSIEKSFDPDLFAQKSLLDQVSDLYENMKTTSDVVSFFGMNESVNSLFDKIDASAKCYAKLDETRKQVLSAITAGSLNDDAVTYLTTWANETDAVAPGAEYPVGNYAYLKVNRQITGEEATAEYKRISAYMLNNEKNPDEPLYPTYIFVDGTSNDDNWGDSPIENLIDGNAKDTKWGTGTGKDRYIIFKTDQPIRPTYYGLVTGWDTDSYKDRNWKNWKIWGANFNSDEEATKDAEGWVLIDNKENVGTDILKTTNLFESYIYLSEGCAEPYQYFKIEVYHTGGMQMNEFAFYNTANMFEYREGYVEDFIDYDPDEKPAYRGLTDAYKAKYEELKNTVYAPDVLNFKYQLEDLQKEIAASAELYHKYDSVYSIFKDLEIESKTYGVWFTDYTSENIAPNAKFINGTRDYIWENMQLDDEGIKAETTYLERIINAVQNNLYILLDGHTVGQWGDGFYGNLIDGIALNTTKKEKDPDTGEEKEVEVKATKWGGQADPKGDTYIIFRTFDPVNPFFYTLTTGNDTGSYPERNWGTWYIYGANFEGDAQATKDADGWVLVDERVNVQQDRLHPVNAEPSYFGFSTETTVPYTYYKVVVTNAYKGDAIQMNELHFGTADEFDDLKTAYKDSADVFIESIEYAQQSLLDQFRDSIPNIETCTNMEALFRANYVLDQLREKITSSAALYEELSNKATEINDYLTENKLAESEALTKLVNYLTTKGEPSETYPNGTFVTIYDEHELNDSIIAVEIESLDAMKKAAIAVGYGPGMDITDLIVNRSFAKAEKVLDANGKEVTGTKTAEGWNGYLYSNGTNAAGTMSAAEFCNEQSKANISQTLTGLKNGYYQIKLNAGFRPQGNINSFDYAALAFANDTKTYVPVVRDYMVTSKEEAWTGSTADKTIYACDVDGVTGEASVDSVEVGYVIWGVQGTINAILHDRYEITMVAQVTDGNLTFGLKNEGTIKGGDWLAAGNFRLTYLGEQATAEAIAAAAECNAKPAANLISAVAGNPNTVDDFKVAPNFAAAQKEALQNVANSNTVEQLVADGNLFAEITATKAAYYSLCYYADAVEHKWYDMAYDQEADADVLAISKKLGDVKDLTKGGDYENAAAAKAAMDELLAKYPDYLAIDESASTYISNASEGMVDGDSFNYEIAPESEKRVAVYFSGLYDDLEDDETLIEFEYKSDKDINNVEIQNFSGDMQKKVVIEKLEASSEFKKVTVNVKDLGFKKASDVLLFRFMPNDGALVNIRHMIFAVNPAKEGDLTGDNEVNAADIQKLLNIIAAGGDADLTGDGETNAADIQKLLNIIAAQ